MLPPHELKSKEFTRVMRGYSSVEVDEHIDFIIEKYTELYRANDELEKQLKAVNTKYDELKTEEDAIRSAMLDARRASAKITAEANERADVIVRSAKTNCDKLVAEFRQKIKSERELLFRMREAVTAFKHAMFENYRTHIEYLEQLSPDISPDIFVPGDDEYTKKVVSLIKEDIVSGTIALSDTIEEASPQLEEVDISEAIGYIPEPLLQTEAVDDDYISGGIDNNDNSFDYEENNIGANEIIETDIQQEYEDNTNEFIETEDDSTEFDFDENDIETSSYDEMAVEEPQYEENADEQIIESDEADYAVADSNKPQPPFVSRRSQIAPQTQRQRGSRVSIKDAINEINKSFELEDMDEEEKLDKLYSETDDMSAQHAEDDTKVHGEIPKKTQNYKTPPENNAKNYSKNFDRQKKNKSKPL